MSQTCEYCEKNGFHTERCPNAGFQVCDLIEDICPDFQFILNKRIPPNTYMEFWVGQGCAYYVRNNKGTKKSSFSIVIHMDNMGMTHPISRAISLSSKDTRKNIE